MLTAAADDDDDDDVFKNFHDFNITNRQSNVVDRA